VFSPFFYADLTLTLSCEERELMFCSFIIEPFSLSLARDTPNNYMINLSKADEQRAYGEIFAENYFWKNC
jgi:hypothetical protein